MSAWLNELWYGARWRSLWLLPLSWLFHGVVTCRTYLFRTGFRTRYVSKLPVVVVGNITVGGAGKTPTVLALIDILQREGFKPGVVSRGYGGKYKTEFAWVTDQQDARHVGDEPKLIQLQTGVPVVVARKRALAVQQLEAHADVDVIIADDGLQHYALQRDIEIAVVDGMRYLGNQLLMPAGPLREPASRLKSVDFVLTQGGFAEQNKSMHRMDLEVEGLYSLVDQKPIDWPLRSKVVGMAGIGYPQRFQRTLEQSGFNIATFFAFADHKAFTALDLKRVCTQGLPVVMTEKDAVKCKDFPASLQKNLYYLRVTPCLPHVFEKQFITLLRNKINGL